MTARKKASRKSSSTQRGTAKSGRKKAAPKRITNRKTAAKKKAARKKAAANKKTAKKKKVVKKTTKKKGGKKTGKKGAAKKRKTTLTKARTKRRATTGNRRKTRRQSRANDGDIHGIQPYRARPGEEYMNEKQLEHFREILLGWKVELMQEADRTVYHMRNEASNFPDPNDRATQESEFGLELRTRDRERKLLKKIDQALVRIDDRSYGFCEETGEEIGLQRLEARPVATLGVEAQERREVSERQYRDHEDRYR